MFCSRASGPSVSLRAFDAVTFAQSLPRRARHHPVLPRPRLAWRRRAGGGDGFRLRRRGERAAPAHRARSSASHYLPLDALAGGANASERAVVAGGVLLAGAGGRIAGDRGATRWRSLSLYVLAGLRAGESRRVLRLKRRRRWESVPARLRASLTNRWRQPGSMAAIRSPPFRSSSPRPCWRRGRTGRRSDRTSAAAGSLHPGASPAVRLCGPATGGTDVPSVEYWAPQSEIWDAAWGSPGL